MTSLHDPWTVHPDPLFNQVARALSGPSPLETAADLIFASSASETELTIARRKWLAKYREIYGEFREFRDG